MDSPNLSPEPNVPPAVSELPHDLLLGRYAKHVNPMFIELLGLLGYGRVLVRGEGTRLWDDTGREYLDLLAAFGAMNLGHSHPQILESLKAALDANPVHFCHTGPSGHETHLAHALVQAADAPLELALFSSSGAEAVEAGLKLARAATRRDGALYCEGGYHGTSLGTLSIMGAERMRKPFEPLVPNCTAVPFGDLEALSAALASKKFAAFVLEPIQAEAGVRMPPTGYLASAQELCRAHGTLLVLDEVQTGIGRTGTLFAYQAEGFVPDVLVLAKSLGGGVVGVAATLTSRAIFRRAYGTMDRFDLHSSTFAGNALACTAACATLDIVAREELAEKSKALGERLQAELRYRLSGHPLVSDIRGRGLLIGVELSAPSTRLLSRLVDLTPIQKLAPAFGSLLSMDAAGDVIGQWIAVRLMEAGIVCQPSAHSWNVLKIEPPLIITEAELDRFVSTLGLILDDYQSLPSVAKDVLKRLATQRSKDWRW